MGIFYTKKSGLSTRGNPHFSPKKSTGFAGSLNALEGHWNITPTPF